MLRPNDAPKNFESNQLDFKLLLYLRTHYLGWNKKKAQHPAGIVPITTLLQGMHFTAVLLQPLPHSPRNVDHNQLGLKLLLFCAVGQKQRNTSAAHEGS